MGGIYKEQVHKKILIKAKRDVFSEYLGSHKSKMHGDGYDFSELRKYEVGDDIRHIDWIVSAKKQEPYVKVFHKEHQLTMTIVPILGGSVYFGSKILKQELIAQICAIIGFSSVKNSDLFRYVISSDKIEKISKLTKKVPVVSFMFEEILKYDVIGKKSNIDKLEEELMLRLSRRNLIFLVGDFLDKAEESLLPNINILAKKHEIIAVVVRDKLEEQLPPFGQISLVDPSSNNSFEGSIGLDLSKKYKQTIDDYDHKLNNFFNKHRIRHLKIYTDEDPYMKLTKFFRV